VRIVRVPYKRRTHAHTPPTEQTLTHQYLLCSAPVSPVLPTSPPHTHHWAARASCQSRSTTRTATTTQTALVAVVVLLLGWLVERECVRARLECAARRGGWSRGRSGGWSGGCSRGCSCSCALTSSQVCAPGGRGAHNLWACAHLYRRRQAQTASKLSALRFTLPSLLALHCCVLFTLRFT